MVITILMIFLNCDSTNTDKFHAQVPSVQKPWSNLDFNDSEDKFQFAIVSDRTAGVRIGVFDRAIDKLNLLQPDFVMSVGDLVTGWSLKINGVVTDSTEVKQEWDLMNDMVNRLEMPFFHVPGNNDLMSPALIEAWENRHGPTYYDFEYKGAHFIVLSTDDFEEESITTQGRVGQTQVDWLENVLSSGKNYRWTFLFFHRPLWTNNPAEWEKIQHLIQGPKKAIFTGHLHQYGKTELNGVPLYTLATTGGISALNGVSDGTFDHITLVTLKKGAPIIANLLLEGIYNDAPGKD